MKNDSMRWSLLVIVLIGSNAYRALGEEPNSDAKALTFFGWSDQHVQTDGKADHLVPAIDAMNSLPGTAFPESIGGQVAKPSFVFGCGDITEWPTNAAMKTYDRLVTKRLKFPAMDVIGNHDEGGNSPSDTIKRWLISRHGALSYAFERQGVHFIALYSKYDESLNSPAQPLTDDSLKWLRSKLSEVAGGAPVIVATHLCFDALTNRDALIAAIGDANVIAILGGHYHKAAVNQYRGRTFLQLPSPAPGSPSEFTVVRITADRLVAIPYDYERKEWSDDARKRLDVSIRRP